MLLLLQTNYKHRYLLNQVVSHFTKYIKTGVCCWYNIIWIDPQVSFLENLKERKSSITVADSIFGIKLKKQHQTNRHIHLQIKYQS